MSEDSADVEDDSSPSESGRTYLSSLANNNWVKAASYGFQFAMDAIDKVPKWIPTSVWLRFFTFSIKKFNILFLDNKFIEN